jgi:Putative transposase
VRCHANERLKLERLCRYITRPALANDRVKINAKGQVELMLKTPWRDGTTHHVMSLLEFMQRLAVLVPRAQLHLVRCSFREIKQRQRMRRGLLKCLSFFCGIFRSRSHC